MPPSRPRHAAPVPSRRRTVLVPAVLLLSVGAALGGLAVLPAGLASPIAVTAAAATTPMLVNQPATGTTRQRDLEADIVPKPAPARAVVRASRARRIAPPAPTYVRPGVGPLTSGFSWRWGRMHTGIDLAGPYGSPVRSVAAGTVVFAGYDGGYGLLVQVQLDDGVLTYYAHNSRLRVSTGDRVAAGTQVAEEGSSGHSTGPHVHFEVRIDGTPIDPVPWLASHGVFV